MRSLGCSRRFANRRTPVVLGHLLILVAMAGASRAVAGDESSPLAATSALPSPDFYLSLGLGDTSIGPVAIANLSADWKNVLIRVSASRTTSFALDGPPAVAITDYSGLVGGVVRAGLVRTYAAVGIGRGATTRRGPRLPPAEGSSPFGLANP